MIRAARHDHPMAFRALTALAAALLVCCVLAGRADAGSWGPPVDITPAGDDAETIQIGADAAGDQIAVWTLCEGSARTVQAADRPAGGTWSAPIDLSAPGRNVQSATVAVNAAGEAAAAWVGNEGPSSYQIEVAHGDVAGNWEAPVKVSSATTSSFEPDIGIDAAGDAVAAWRQYVEPNYAAATAIEEAGVWGTPQVLSNPADTNENPVLAVNPAGDAVVAWERSEAVEASSLTAGGSFDAPTVLQTAGTGLEYTRVAINGPGEAIVVWANGSGPADVVESARVEAGGGWRPTVTVAEGADSYRQATVALTDSGEARAAWQDDASGAETIETATSIGAGPWSAAVTVSTSEEAYEPLVAIDPLGDATIVWWGWTEEFGGNYATYAARLAAGGTWGSQLDLSEPAEELYYPVLAVDATGAATVAWLFYNEGADLPRSVYLSGATSSSPSGDGSKPPTAPKAAANPGGPILCTAPSGAPTAAAFTPTPKPGKTVPGVRARITVPARSRLAIAATISYKQGGKWRSADAGTYAMTLAGSRNLKVPLPSSLRSKLPLGTDVHVALRIAMTPAAASACAAPKTTTSKLRLKVVRVIAGK